MYTPCNTFWAPPPKKTPHVTPHDQACRNNYAFGPKIDFADELNFSRCVLHVKCYHMFWCIVGIIVIQYKAFIIFCFFRENTSICLIEKLDGDDWVWREISFWTSHHSFVTDRTWHHSFVTNRTEHSFITDRLNIFHLLQTWLNIIHLSQTGLWMN